MAAQGRESFDHASVAGFYSLGQVARERIDVVSQLEALVADHGTVEGKFQELIELAPWLLAPEWTPLGMNETLGRVRSQFENWYRATRGEEIVTSAITTPRRRPDFVLLDDAGTLWIVEIKRMDFHLTDEEFVRASNYLGALKEFLDANPALAREFPRQRLTFVVDHIDKLNYTSKSSLESDPELDRKTWHELLSDTKKIHQDFLTRVQELQTRGAAIEP